MEKSEFPKSFNGFSLYKDIMTIQDGEELSWLTSKVESIRPKVILEIGMERGGTLKVWETIAGDESIVIGCDITLRHIDKSIVFGSNVHLIEGSSRETGTMDTIRSILNGKQIDFLFIDGDHSPEGVIADYQNFSPLVRSGGLIGFHDIQCNAGVREFWGKLGGNKEVKIVNIGTGILWK